MVSRLVLSPEESATAVAEALRDLADRVERAGRTEGASIAMSVDSEERCHHGRIYRRPSGWVRFEIDITVVEPPGPWPPGVG